MNILGVDAGLSGGFAVLDGSGRILLVDDLPTIGEGTQRRIDAANLAGQLRSFLPAVAIVEQVHAMPGQGVSSMFRFGQAVGTVAGVIGALGCPLVWVTPQRWKKAMGCDATAERSRGLAIETWPENASLFSRKKDHNRAEAALIGLWSIRHQKFNGGYHE